MNCHEFENTIEAYIDGFLDDDLRRTMDEHRALCPECARLAKAHSLVMRSFDHPEPVAAPQGLESRILAAVDAYKSETVSVAHPYPRFGMIAASITAFGSLAVSVIFIGKLLLKNSTEISTGVAQIGTMGAIVHGTKTWFVMAMYMLHGYLRGWLATVQPRIPEQLLYMLKLASEPVPIPYLSFSLPVYMLIVMAALPLIIRPYLSDSSYSAAAQRS